jgi:peptidoglycan/xylan/chitin deacetylase (PgdA/CDA1 family)/folate-dependent phosphoribosylglycinamide formyltransferase PurN
MPPFRLVIFSSKTPDEILRLIRQLQREVPAAKVCAVLYEKRPRKTLSTRLRLILSKLSQPDYLDYASREFVRRSMRMGAKLRDCGIRFLHACPPSVAPPRSTSLDDLTVRLEQLGVELLIVPKMHEPEVLAFVERQKADLGVVFGTGILKRSLFDIPRLGSINLHKRKLPDYRGGGPVGLWEMLDGCTEIGVTVHRVDDTLDTGAVLRTATIPIDDYDDMKSLALKAAVVGGDLICGAVSDLAEGKEQPMIQPAGGKLYRAPSDPQKLAYEKELRRRRPMYIPKSTRPAWKLLARSTLLLPFVLVRNWIYRWKKAFPIIIFYHHVITDRPHHLGTPTAEFANQVEFLRKFYRIASLEQAMQMLAKGEVTEPTIVLTFDDGYADNAVNLRAVAEQYAIPVFLFVSTGHISDGKAFGHDIRRKQEGFAPLSWKQIVSLHQTGFSFGCHTRSHFDCGSTDVAVLESEIGGSQTELSERAGIWSEYFSFPWGMPKNMSPEAQQIAKSHFKYVFAAAGGANVVGTAPESTLLRRVDHPSMLWEVELAIQSALNFDSWRDIFPGIF